MSVIAIDPALLEGAVLGLPNVRHLRCRAEEAVREAGRRRPGGQTDKVISSREGRDTQPSELAELRTSGERVQQTSLGVEWAVPRLEGRTNGGVAEEAVPWTKGPGSHLSRAAEEMGGARWQEKYRFVIVWIIIFAW